MSVTLWMRLGPHPNELDAMRSLHRRQDVATPDDRVDVICATCYILDEGWPCTVARLIAVIDAQIADEEAGRRADVLAACPVCGAIPFDVQGVIHRCLHLDALADAPGFALVELAREPDRPTPP